MHVQHASVKKSIDAKACRAHLGKRGVLNRQPVNLQKLLLKLRQQLVPAGPQLSHLRSRRTPYQFAMLGAKEGGLS